MSMLPLWKYMPAKKLASTSTVITMPWKTMSTPMPPAKTPSEALRGLRFMTSPSASSMPSAGWKIVKPTSVATKTESTSAMFAESRNWMTLRMLS